MRYTVTFIYFTFLICQSGLAQEIIVKPYLQNAFPNEMTIMWEVDDTGIGEIQYGLSPFALSQVQQSASQLGSGQSQIHTAILTGLSQGNKYYYRVSMENGQTSILYSFISPSSQSSETGTQLVAISDMQRDGSHPDKFEEIVTQGIIPIIYAEMGNSIEDLEAILIPGDLVPTGGNYSEWKDFFFNPSEDLLSHVPLYPVLGNHEYFGGGFPNFIKYFTLPDNGPLGLDDQCWYKDISNVRVIGLNSNSGTTDRNAQLDWLGALLNSTCLDDQIDFVFAQLHHPYKSELWTPGESDFTGMVIDSLQGFSTECNKPSIHFFGHTHGYSRGQSRDHKHLWVNVATAGGAIDNWGEFPNADYPEFVKSQDEYGFVILDTEAGLEPKFTLKRYSRGDQDIIEDNVVKDELTIYKHEYIPSTPENIFPISGATISALCLKLKASQFYGVNDSMQASHWQIAKSDNFVDSLVTENWYQNENFYFDINLQADDDLTDAEFNSLDPNKTYFWRTRYRDQSLEWSDWSNSSSFYLDPLDTLSSNLVINGGAENGITSWIGDIESLENAACSSIAPFEGTHNFAVGGVCANEMNEGLAYQEIDVQAYSTAINNEMASASFGGYLRNYNGEDIPEMYIECYDSNNILLSTSELISNITNVWTNVGAIEMLPINTTKCHLYLKGTRHAGTDNDSYFDNISFYVLEGSCSNCYGNTSIDQDGDGFCSDLDCNDTNPNVFPGALELCDGLDNNCDGVWDQNNTVTWTGNAGDNQWGSAMNWDQDMVPLPCQFVVIANADSIIVDGVFACKGVDAGPNCGITIPAGSYLKIDSMNDVTINPGCFSGLLLINGKWEVK